MVKNMTLQRGFALPSVLIASVVMMIVLVTAVSAVTTSRTALNNQYYNQLAQEATESGALHAQECVFENQSVATWGSGMGDNGLRPGVDCNGAPQCSTPNCYLVLQDNVRTTYIVGEPTLSPDNSMKVQVVGITELLHPDTGSVRKQYTKTQSAIIRYKTTPQIASGAGWKTSGHNGYMLSGEGTLWGWGDNESYQLGGSATGDMSSTPVRITLPNNMNYVEKFAGSGQGASLICALMVSRNPSIANTVHCRGIGLGMSKSDEWRLFKIPATPAQYPVDVTVQGYGLDGACVLTNIGNVYCIGTNESGRLGLRTTSSAFVPISSEAKLFRLPGSLKAKEVITHDRHTCVIAVDNKAYCAGDNILGQLGRGNTTTNVWVGDSNPERVLIPGNPDVSSIGLSYHAGSFASYFLTKNGDVYMTGSTRSGTGDINTTTNNYSTPRKLTSGTFDKIISIGEEGAANRGSLCAIERSKTGGNTGLFCMGATKYGQVGHGACGKGEIRPRWGGSVPTPSGAARISPNVGRTADYQMNSLMVIDRNGDAYAAGDNTYGKLGTGASYGACNASLKKVRMPAGVKAVEIANADEYSAFILGSDNNLYAMGRNHQGQLGNGTTTNSNVPVKVLIPRELSLYY